VARVPCFGLGNRPVPAIKLDYELVNLSLGGALPQKAFPGAFDLGAVRFKFSPFGGVHSLKTRESGLGTVPSKAIGLEISV